MSHRSMARGPSPASSPHTSFALLPSMASLLTSNPKLLQTSVELALDPRSSDENREAGMASVRSLCDKMDPPAMMKCAGIVEAVLLSMTKATSDEEKKAATGVLRHLISRPENCAAVLQNDAVIAPVAVILKSSVPKDTSPQALVALKNCLAIIDAIGSHEMTSNLLFRADVFEAVQNALSYYYVDVAEIALAVLYSLVKSAVGEVSLKGLILDTTAAAIKKIMATPKVRKESIKLGEELLGMLESKSPVRGIDQRHQPKSLANNGEAGKALEDLPE